MESFEIGRITNLCRCNNYITVNSQENEPKLQEQQRQQQQQSKMNINNSNNNKIMKKKRRRVRRSALDYIRRRTLLPGFDRNIIAIEMRLSIKHTHQCIYDVKTGSRILQPSKNCASQRQTDFTINRLNSNKKSVKGLGTPRGGQGGQNPPKLLGLAGEKFLKINKIFKLGIPGRFF